MPGPETYDYTERYGIACSNSNVAFDEPVTFAGLAKDGFPLYGPFDAVDGVDTQPGEVATLDACNGHEHVTEAFPDGVYHYHALQDEAPNIPSCLTGSFVEADFLIDGRGRRPAMATRPKARPHGRRSTSTGLRAASMSRLSSLLLVGWFVGAVPVATAHDASSAAMKITRQPSNAWVFELQTPLHGLDHAMWLSDEARSRDLGGPSAGSTRYKELIVEYVKATFELDARSGDGNVSTPSGPALGSGRIKLGDHVSVLIFEIEHMPKVVEELTVRLPYMADNVGQQNVLRFVDGDRDERHVLRADNDFTVVDTDFSGSGSSAPPDPTPSMTD